MNKSPFINRLNKMFGENIVLGVLVYLVGISLFVGILYLFGFEYNPK